MVWLAVDKDGTEFIYVYKSERNEGEFSFAYDDLRFVSLPKGSIKKLIGRELTWSDEPVELKDE